MPYEVNWNGASADVGAPSSSKALPLEVRLWPHNSLAPSGFVWFMAATLGMLAIPLVGLLGTVALWGVLPFMLAVVGLLWLSLNRSWRDRSIEETFALTSDAATLIRRDPNGTTRDWTANPYWVRIEMHPKVGTVEDYLTLHGGPRDVEIGAFLTPEERRDLCTLLRRGLTLARE